MNSQSAREIDKLIHVVEDLNTGTLREFEATKKYLADVADSVRRFSHTEETVEDVVVLITRLIDAEAGALINLERRLKVLETIRDIPSP
ncbi:hypothetical protein [Corynebacterium sp.]|uniref:hypothetical protein n=1 Tax=Corynebacterium sp. TaxID=1720 RepID=UPI0026DB58A9|nr:hypothetical protein [Corynebacterium sp.]MDO5077786.1 hypothetical protein [Corynebacterium sp.]